mgnify:CR=1 FL=1
MSLKIVFMGTPEFSIPALKILKQSEADQADMNKSGSVEKTIFDLVI